MTMFEGKSRHTFHHCIQGIQNQKDEKGVENPRYVAESYQA